MEPEAIQEELDRLASSDQLARSKRLLRFLRFTVDRTLKGQGDSLSEYVIGREVYDRTEDFDPLTDGIVRAEAHRLRSKLRDYYNGSGRQDPLMIEYPVGSYVPVFRQWAPEFLPKSGTASAAIRACDWAATPLGPIASWPRTLKLALSVHLRASFPSVILWGSEYTFLCNDAMLALMGDRGKAVIGVPAATVEPENWSVLEPVLQSIFETGECVTWEKRRWLSPMLGHRVEGYFNVSFSSIHEASGEVRGVLIVPADLTGSVLYERRNETISSLAAVLPHARTEDEACREAMRVIEDNPYDVPFASLYLLDSARTCAELRAYAGVDPGTNVSPKAIMLTAGNMPLVAAVASGRPEVLEVGQHMGNLPHGAWADAPREIAVIPLRAVRQSETIGVLVAGVNPHRPLDAAYRGFFDMTARVISGNILRVRRVEREQKLLAEAEHQEQMWAAFCDFAAGELRGPLSVALGLLDQMGGDKGLEKTARSRVTVARRNLLRLVNLVGGLEDLVQIQGGRLQPTFEPTDLGTVTDDLARAFGSALSRSDLNFVLDCPPLGEPAFVDRRLWDKLVLSLLLNAVETTHSGEIGVSVHKMGAWIDTIVWDTGKGIPEGEIGQVFEPFRVQSIGSRRMGFALPLVRQFAILHGGHVTVESSVGKGSKFVVSIPRGSGHLPADRVVEAGSGQTSLTTLGSYVEEALRWAPEHGDPESALETEGAEAVWQRRELVRGRRRRILVAEANRDVRHYLESITQEIYIVDTAADGNAALQALQQNRPDLLLADSDLPGLDGLSLVRAVRADPELGSVPIVLLSTHVYEEDRLRAFAAGANDFLLKPFTAPELLVRLESQIALADTYRRIAEGTKAVQDIELERGFLRAALDQLPIGVIIADRLSGELVVKNSLIREIFGDAASAIVRLSDIPDPFGCRPDGRPLSRAECPLVRASQQGESVMNETIVYIAPDGRRHTMVATASPIRDADGRHVGGFCMYSRAHSVRS